MQLLAKTLSHIEAMHRAEVAALTDRADDIHEIEQILQGCRVRLFSTRVRASFGHLVVSAAVGSAAELDVIATSWQWRVSETLGAMGQFEGETGKGRPFKLLVVSL